MTPQEAKAAYDAEWPALNKALHAATDPAVKKRCRQALSALSLKYSARLIHEEPQSATLEGLIEEALQIIRNTPGVDTINISAQEAIEKDGEMLPIYIRLSTKEE
jgi:hypothetical protein